MKKNEILLAVDVGNTAILLGVFCDSRLVFRTSVPTKECKKKIGKRIVRLLHFVRNDRHCESEWGGNLVNLSAIVGSVVPGVDKVIKNGLQKARIRCRFVKRLDIGISIRCRETEKVGVDRLLNAVAEHKFYKKAAIVVDCGTATTFDVVSPKGEYLGGAIAPGLRIGAEALAQRCAKLFQVPLTFPRFAVGRDTKEAMLSGIILGHIAMIEGMIGKLKRELKFKPIIIGTGGFISLIANRTKIFDTIDQDLTLKGLAIVAGVKKTMEISYNKSSSKLVF